MVTFLLINPSLNIKKKHLITFLALLSSVYPSIQLLFTYFKSKEGGDHGMALLYNNNFNM